MPDLPQVISQNLLLLIVQELSLPKNVFVDKVKSFGCHLIYRIFPGVCDEFSYTGDSLNKDKLA